MAGRDENEVGLVYDEVVRNNDNKRKLPPVDFAKQRGDYLLYHGDQLLLFTFGRADFAPAPQGKIIRENLDVVLRNRVKTRH